MAAAPRHGASHAADGRRTIGPIHQVPHTVPRLCGADAQHLSSSAVMTKQWQNDHVMIGGKWMSSVVERVLSSV
jgi:hypothetical protein